MPFGKESSGKCRRNRWYAYSNKLAHKSPTTRPTIHPPKPDGRKVPIVTAGKPPHKTAVQVFTRLIARPRAIAVALTSAAVTLEPQLPIFLSNLDGPQRHDWACPLEPRVVIGLTSGSIRRFHFPNHFRFPIDFREL